MKIYAIAALCAAVLIVGCKSRTPEPLGSQQTPENARHVGMTLSAQQKIEMKVETVQAVELNDYLRATGTVQPIDSRVGIVAPLARGRVVKVLSKVGDRVKAGQTLAVFDNIEAGELLAQEQSARAELQRLKAQSSAATRQLERSRRLAEIGAGAEREYETSKAEKEEIDAAMESQQAVIDGLDRRLLRLGVAANRITGSFLTALKAPFSGVVTRVQVSPGDALDAGREAFTVADLERVWVQAEVYEKDLDRLSIGKSAVIRVDTYPNHPFSGQVTYVSDMLDPQTRTARVRCEVANPGLQLKTDMFANVQLPTKFARRALVVPVSALQQVDGADVVFVRTSATEFEARAVQKGLTVDSQVEITSGLQDGEPVVTQGTFHLKSILASGDLGED